MGFLWIGRGFKDTDIDYSFIFLAPTQPALHQQFLNERINSYYIPCRSKFNYPAVFIKLWRYFLNQKPEIVHAQLIEAGLLALTAAKFAGVQRRIYTRHHATYNKYYYPHMVKYDRYINRISTQIIAISNNVKEVLQKDENVPAKKITIIPHGFDLASFKHPQVEEVETLRKIYNAKGKKPVIGVISRFIELKGIQYIIPAFKKFLENEPNSLLILSNTNGNYKSEIEQQLQSLPDDTYLTINFEKNLFALYKLFDYFIHVPIDPTVEAFGQVYVEALAAGIPSIFTISGIAHEFIRDNENALVVPYQDQQAIHAALLRLNKDKKLREKLLANGQRDVGHYFTLEESLNKLHVLYDK